MTKLTHAELTRLLDYDPETGVFRWRVDRRNGAKAGDVVGRRSRYCNQINIKGNSYTSRRLAWFYIYEEIPRNNLFVKNGDKYDDRIDNLGMLPDKPKELTHEYLKQCIDYNPETGEFKWKITTGDAVYGNSAFWINVVRNNNIRPKTSILGDKYMTSRLIVFWMTGYMPSSNRVVMPIDNNVLNLKWSNIKVGSKSEMQMKRKNNGMMASKGVHFNKCAKKYSTYIRINGKQKHIGYYPTEAEAHAAYMKAARKHYGELANDGYNHAMYEMEYEAVEREPVADEGDTYPQGPKSLTGHVTPDKTPAVVHEVGF